MALKKIKNQEIKSYFAFEYSGHLFYVDIITSSEKYESWMYCDNYGVKAFVYGMLKSDITLKDFKQATLEEVDRIKSQYLFDFM